MKKLFILSFFVSCSFHLSAIDITPITNAFKSGNTELLRGIINEEVDIAIPEKSFKGEAGEALKILKSFFDANNSKGFVIVHNADKNESGFIVGKLETEKGGFRVNISYTIKGDEIKITTLRIDKN
jgi:hypothetical protein